MRQSLVDLCNILEEQKQVIGNMLELSKQERQIIIDGESEKLEDIIRLELKELSKLGGIEKRRIELHGTIAKDVGLPVQNLTVTKIAEKVSPTEREKIKAVQKELMALIDEHKAVNMENRELIKAHIDYSEAMVGLMVGKEDPLNNLYSGDGSAVSEQTKKTGFFDGHA